MPPYRGAWWTAYPITTTLVDPGNALGDYTVTNTPGTLTITTGTPSVTTWPTATAISYGQTLSSSTLSGGLASAAGAFSFTTPFVAPGAGTVSASITFTPTDNVDYNAVTGSVNVTVSKATPSQSVTKRGL
jgi:hypothetical protein